jgi:uncharacterized protein (UPF0332 family)
MAMEIQEEHREYVRLKLAQATEAYAEAAGLLADEAELGYVVNSLYYAFYYPVLALLQVKGVPAAMQSVSIALFEREFIDTGLVEKRFFRSLRRAFELKPKCSTPGLKMITHDEVTTLLTDARGFLETVSRETGVK